MSLDRNGTVSLSDGYRPDNAPPRGAQERQGDVQGNSSDEALPLDRRGVGDRQREISRWLESIVSEELTVASAHRSKVHPTTSQPQLLVLLLPLLATLLILLLSPGITLSLCPFSLSLSHPYLADPPTSLSSSIFLLLR